MAGPIKYNSKQKQLIHQLVDTIFSEKEFNEFCRATYPSIYAGFTPEMEKAARIQVMIEICAEQGQLAQLMAKLQQAEPEAYQAFVRQVQMSGQKAAPERSVLATSSSTPLQRRLDNPESLVSQSLADRYRIDEILDRSGIGAVFKAFDTKLQLDVAIKVVDLARMKQSVLRERVQQEVRTAMKLNHPGIVQVYDFGQVDSLVYMVMEFISGLNLNQALQQSFAALDKRTLLPQVIKLVQEICLTVDYMHHQGVLHPSLEPDSIMLKPGQPIEGLPWRPVLINLGLLRPHRESLRANEAVPEEKLIYTVSPELLLGHATDIRSDVYALGLILYELVVGQPPFRPHNLLDAIRMHVEDSPPAPRLLFPDLPEGLEQVMLKALAKDPADRYLSARGLAQALADGLAGREPRSALGPAVDISLTTEMQQLAAEPGESIVIPLHLHNQGRQENRCRIRVEGIPPEWVSLSPSATLLSPGEEQEVLLTIQPPRAALSRAGRHALIIQVIGQPDGRPIDEIRRNLAILPYVQFNANLWPQELISGQVAEVTVENQGNTAATFTIEPRPEAGLTFQPGRAQLKLTPGESSLADFRVHFGHRRLIGETRAQTFSFIVGTSQGQPVTLVGQVTSRGALTLRWALALALVIFLVLCGLAAFYPLINPSADAVTATFAVNKATADAATARLVEAQMATVAAGTVQAIATQQAMVQSTAERESWLNGDDDLDGLLNRDELARGTLSNNRDTDADGLDDYAEVTQFNTNPLGVDTDYDGLPDAQEVQLGLNPRSIDSDGDGIPDAVDTAPNQPPTATPTATPIPPATPVPVVRFSNMFYTVNEREQSANITVVLDGNTSSQVVVGYTTRSGSATAGNDYSTTAGTLIFEPGQPLQTFSIPILADTVSESDETVFLELLTPQGAVLGTNNQATLTIIDDDEPG